MASSLDKVVVLCSVVTLLPAPAGMQHGVMFHNPQRSPDGEWFLFDSNLGSRQELYVIRRDGSGLHALTDTPDESEGGPTWADEGRAITYTVGLAGHGQRYRLRLDRDMRPVGSREPTADESFVAWSPDRRQALVLRQPPGSRQQVFLQSGGTVVQLTEGPYSEQPSFSPDGASIVYEVRIDDPPYEYVMLMRPDGSGRRQLSIGSDPSWSPDGRLVLFKSAPDGKAHVIVTMRPDGTDRREHGRGAHPEWSSDGTEISWMADRPDGGTDIMVVPVAGGRPECITCRIAR